MGSIRRHKDFIESIIFKNNLKYYIETGTGEGECLSYANTLPFNRLYSIEIYDEIHKKAVEKFSQFNNIHIMKGNSYEVIPSILKKIDGNVLFFLDAHFPGVDFHFESFGSEKDKDKNLPLEKELKTIIENFDTKNSVFIIDDLRIYEDGPYTGGNWPDRHLYGGDNINFIYDLFNKTHNIVKDFNDQGYIILTPKT